MGDASPPASRRRRIAGGSAAEWTVGAAQSGSIRRQAIRGLPVNQLCCHAVLHRSPARRRIVDRSAAELGYKDRPKQSGGTSRTMTRKLFGTDGIRGTANQEPM